jgi:hypothetical protein
VRKLFSFGARNSGLFGKLFPLLNLVEISNFLENNMNTETYNVSEKSGIRIAASKQA